jgi:hypothetical protein
MNDAVLKAAFLLRKRPDPIPHVFPLPEYLADGDRKKDYEDTKAVFQVPWMGVIAMCFSHYRKFYRTLWGGLRPVFKSAEFVTSCNALCRRAEQLATELSPPPLAEVLAAKGYALRELQNIRDMIEIFHHGNFPYVLLATTARILLEGKELSARRTATASSERHALCLGVEFPAANCCNARL